MYSFHSMLFPVLKIKISCETLSFSNDGITKTRFTLLPETSGMAGGVSGTMVLTHWPSAMLGSDDGGRGNKQGEPCHQPRPRPPQSHQAAAQGGEPGRLPKLRRWSQMSREALQTLATVERRELHRERQRALRICKIFRVFSWIPIMWQNYSRLKKKHPKILDAKIPADHLGPANLCFH